MTEFKRILLATNFDSASSATLDAAADLARAVGGRIHVLCVLEALMYTAAEMAVWAERDPRTHPEVTRKLRETVEALRARGVEEVDGGVEYGIAGDLILRRANEGGHDLLVIGGRGRVGGVGEFLVANAKIPVITVPG
jgi:nucleotide-binding universal stress UspA family protein